MENKYASINLNVRGLGQSPTLAINEYSRKLQTEGKQVYRMGLGQSPFPVPVSVVEALKNHAHEKDYLHVKGLEALRHAVTHFHRQKDGVNILPENVLIGPGSKELMFLLQLVYYGDIILPTPCWVSYVPQAKIIGRNIKLLHTRFEDNWKITARQLEQFLQSENDQYKPRLIVLNYPSNPHGETHRVDELEELAAIARKYELIVLSDEIYGQLHYDGKHVSIATFYPERTIISSGLSKWCGAGGWRLGTFSFPPNFHWLLNPMAAVASETYTSVCAPIQYAAVSAFRGSIGIERYLMNVRRILRYLAVRCIDLLRNGGLNVHMPSGGFYLYIDFTPFKERLVQKGIATSADVCTKLLEETGVAILPGTAFMQPEGELTARVAFVNFDGAKALAMSESIPMHEALPDDFCTDYCKSVLTAINLIVDWVHT